MVLYTGITRHATVKYCERPANHFACALFFIVDESFGEPFAQSIRNHCRDLGFVEVASFMYKENDRESIETQVAAMKETGIRNIFAGGCRDGRGRRGLGLLSKSTLRSSEGPSLSWTLPLLQSVMV
jgi:hypothetical protein